MDDGTLPVSVQGVEPLDPGDIWRLIVEVTRDRVHQDWEGGPAPQAARLPYRKDPLHPAVALGIGGPMHQLTPQDRKPECPLRPVIGGLYPCLHQACVAIAS
jgi:hypothetical protein